MTKPFFMRFVETQAPVDIPTNVKAGADDDKKKKTPPKKEWECLKYPSDGDEWTYDW